jgi:hypothetical protein
MHWIKTTDTNGNAYLDLSTGNLIGHSDNGVLAFIINGEMSAIPAAVAPAILARLDALAEIATARTVANLPAPTEETE